MPIYEYNCRCCNQNFERIVVTKAEKITCPKCNSAAVEKQLSIFSSPASRAEPGESAGSCGCTPQSCGCH